MSDGYVPGECDPKPLTANQVNLLQHENLQLRERVTELEAELKSIAIQSGVDIEGSPGGDWPWTECLLCKVRAWGGTLVHAPGCLMLPDHGDKAGS